MYQGIPSLFAPVAESAYCGAGILHAALLHLQAGVVRFFQGIPEASDDALWANVSFGDLRVEPGVVASAARENGRTRFVRIAIDASRASRSVLFGIDNDADERWTGQVPPQISSGGGEARVVAAPGVQPYTVWNLTLGPATADAYLYVTPDAPDFGVAPVEGNSSLFHFFGYKFAMQPLH